MTDKQIEELIALKGGVLLEGLEKANDMVREAWRLKNAGRLDQTTKAQWNIVNDVVNADHNKENCDKPKQEVANARAKIGMWPTTPHKI